MPKIAVIGDVMLDKYVNGLVERISPEAPIPILKVTSERYVPGGAANVAANIASLGGEVVLFGVVGEDVEGSELKAKLKSLNVESRLFKSSSKTIVKTRMVSMSQQLLRIDNEDKPQFDHELFEREILKSLSEVDCVVVSDYDKGTLAPDFIHRLLSECKRLSIKTIVDPKPKHKDSYKGAYLLTPNQKEAAEMLHRTIITDDDAIEASKVLERDLDCFVLMTRGEHGVLLGNMLIPAEAKQVYDVSGAGDTVVAVMALSLCEGKNLLESASLANRAAGIVVGKSGTATLTREELK